MLLSQAIKKKQVSTCRKTLASPANTPKARALSVTPSLLARASFSRQATTPSKQNRGATSTSSRHEENAGGEDDASEHGSEINIVEQIVDKKVTRSGGALYFVRWLGGISDEDNTWEPEESLIKKYNCRSLIESYERRAADIGNQQGHASSSDSNHPSPIVPTATTNQPASSKPHSSSAPSQAHPVIESDSSDYTHSPSPSPPRGEMAPAKAKKVERAVKGPRMPAPTKKKTASTASTIPADENDDDQMIGYDNVPVDHNEDDGEEEVRDDSEEEQEEEEEQSGDAEPVYEVEKILDKCFDKRKRPLYEVKWKGYEEKTWEPKSSFKTCDAMLQNFEAKIKNMKQKPLQGGSSASRARSQSRASSVANRSLKSVSSTPKTPAAASIMPPPAQTTSGSAASSKRAPPKPRGASMERSQPSAAPRHQPARKPSVGGSSGLGDVSMTLSREKPARLTLGTGSGGAGGGGGALLNTLGHDFTATVAKLGGSNKRARSSSVVPTMRPSIGGTPKLATMGAGLMPSAKKARKDVEGQSTSSNSGGRSHEPSPPSATNSSSDAGTTPPVRTLDLLDGTTLILTDSFKIEGVLEVERGDPLNNNEPVAKVQFSDGSHKWVGTAHLSTRAPEELIGYYERYLHLYP